MPRRRISKKVRLCFPTALIAGIQQAIDNEDVADNYESLLDEIHEIKDTLEELKQQQQQPATQETVPAQPAVVRGISEQGVIEILNIVTKK